MIISTIIRSNLLEIKSSICGKILSDSIPKISSCCRFIKLRKLVLSVNSLINPATVVSEKNNDYTFDAICLINICIE